MALPISKQGSFSKLLSGFTSDHAYQIAKVETYDDDGHEYALTGMTWNLLNRGHAATEERMSNNPFNLEEEEQSYYKRKKHQLKFIWSQIKTGQLDYVNLQEVDMFYLDPRPDWVKIFLQAVHKFGWEIVATTKEDHVKQPLMIFYNAAKLRFISKRTLFPADGSGLNTGLEGMFFYKGIEACIVNVHLDYNTDHRDEIIKYQLQQVGDSRFTIIAGDTNPGPGVEYYNFTGDANYPTSLHAVFEDEEEAVGDVDNFHTLEDYSDFLE